MKIKTQIAMVLNLDKCIGCHTCSVTCKNVWTSRKGMEYAWWNNVETKPGPGYPKTWEDQDKYRGGWRRAKDGSTTLRLGNRPKVMSQLFSNPYLPQAMLCCIAYVTHISPSSVYYEAPCPYCPLRSKGRTLPP